MNAATTSQRTPSLVAWVHADSESTFVRDVVAQIGAVVAAGGPDSYGNDRFSHVIDRIWQALRNGHLGPHGLATIRAAFADALSPATLQGQALAKKYGYTGDFEILDALYTFRVTTLGQLVAWDEYLLAQAAPQAVRNRKEYAKALLRAVEDGAEQEVVRVLNVASGPGRDICEYFDERPDSRLRVVCVDKDRRALDYARALCHRYQDRVTFVRANLEKLCLNDKFDLVWSAGLFDYFEDAEFVRQLTRLKSFVAPGGSIVVGNFSTRNPTRAYMEVIADWHLHHRSRQTLEQLAAAVATDGYRVHVESEPLGINLFLHLTHER